MVNPKFNGDGLDVETFFPFELETGIRSNELETGEEEVADFRLVFCNSDWMGEHYGDYVDGYYLNGSGVEGLVKACRLQAGLELDPGKDAIFGLKLIKYNSEADTCYIHFLRLEDAVETAKLAADMIHDAAKMSAMVKIANENGFG